MEPDAPVKRSRGRPRKIPVEPVPEPAPEPILEEPVPEPILEEPVPEPIHDVHIYRMPELPESPPPQLPPPPPPPPAPAPAPTQKLRAPQLQPPRGLPPINYEIPDFDEIAQPAVLLRTTDLPEAKHKILVLTKLRRYQQHFEAVRNLQFSDDWPLEKLEAMLDQVRSTIATADQHTMVKGSYLSACKLAEFATQRAGMKTAGTAQILAQSQAVDAALLELEIEYLSGARMRPEQKLLLATVGAFLAVHNLNSQQALLKNIVAESVKDGIAQKFSDL